MCDITEEAVKNKQKNQSHISFIMGNTESNYGISKDNKLIKPNKNSIGKRSITPIDYKRKSNLVCSDCYNAHEIEYKENGETEQKQIEKQKDLNVKKRWEEEADRIMKIVSERKVKEKAVAEVNRSRINSYRNGCHKTTITPKITDRKSKNDFLPIIENTNDENHTVEIEKIDYVDNEDAQSDEARTLCKKDLAKEYDKAIKQANEKKNIQKIKEKKEDQERLQNTMREHQKKLLEIVEMKKVF